MKQLCPEGLSPNAAMIVVMAKLPSKLLPLADVYCPTAQVHVGNDTLMLRAYKHTTGISRHGYTAALWWPREHGYQGFTRYYTRGGLQLPRNGSGNGRGPRRNFESLRPTPSRHTKRSEGIPYGAYPRAIHRPSAVPPPHRYATTSSG